MTTQRDMERHMRDLHGYALIETGGGCTAYTRTFTGGFYLLITIPDDPTAPETISEPVTIGYYGPKHSEALMHENCANVAAAIEWASENIGINPIDGTGRMI